MKIALIIIIILLIIAIISLVAYMKELQEEIIDLNKQIEKQNKTKVVKTTVKRAKTKKEE